MIRNPQAKFYKEKINGGHKTFMELSYEQVKKDIVERVTIHKLSLDDFKLDSEGDSHIFDDRVCIQIEDYLRLPMLPNKDRSLVTVETIKRRMTIKEIEKELGYKIEISD